MHQTSFQMTAQNLRTCVSEDHLFLAARLKMLRYARFVFATAALIACEQRTLPPENRADVAIPRNRIGTGDRIFVAANGNDQNAGTIESPKQNLSAAFAVVASGGQVIMRGGEYRIDAAHAPWVRDSGRADARTSVFAYGNEKPVLRPAANVPCFASTFSHVEVQGIDCRGGDGIKIVGASDVVIWGNAVSGAGEAGIGVYPRSATGDAVMRDIVIGNNNVSETQLAGIAVGIARLGSVQRVYVGRNVVTRTNLQYADGVAGDWKSGIVAIGVVDVTVEGNQVSKNFGEGINCVLSSRCTIRQNTVWDNRSVQLYADNASESLWEGNLVYNTGDRTYFRDGRQATGIQFGNERGWFDARQANDSRNNTVRNNIILDAWEGVSINGGYGSTETGFKNFLVEANTIVRAAVCGLLVTPSAGNQSNVVQGNIVVPSSQTSQLVCGLPANGYTFQNQLWASGSAGAASSRDDVIGEPGFVLGTGTIAANYQLTASSRAIDGGTSLLKLTSDFFGVARPNGVRADIGAAEFVR
jgi:parallel beta-helix repeat protein